MARALVALLGAAYASSYPGPGCPAPLMAEPVLQLQDAVDGLLVDFEAVVEAKKGPDPAVAEGGMCSYELQGLRHQELI